MSTLLDCVSSQIQRAINEANIEHVLPQIQATLWPGQGQVFVKGGSSRLRDRNTDLKKLLTASSEVAREMSFLET